ncbi:C-type lectin domain family 2 member L-like [Platysternon megacephalum]|uniref:C-type lectin domain family 2 member L-like n=1 Tax=Platysternon megacephalum TaxID=55544 RepID=A0A4D9DQ64_9SAUR|nr:C-type lectin domain family 2 member L-like [Platysternon megacephalum]
MYPSASFHPAPGTLSPLLGRERTTPTHPPGIQSPLLRGNAPTLPDQRLSGQPPSPLGMPWPEIQSWLCKKGPQCRGVSGPLGGLGMAGTEQRVGISIPTPGYSLAAAGHSGALGSWISPEGDGLAPAAQSRAGPSRHHLSLRQALQQHRDDLGLYFPSLLPSSHSAAQVDRMAPPRPQCSQPCVTCPAQGCLPSPTPGIWPSSGLLQPSSILGP